MRRSKSFILAALLASSSFASQASAAADEWLFLERYGSGIASHVKTTVSEVVQEQLKGVGAKTVAQERVTRMLRVLGATAIEAADLADITGGIGAGHALLVVIEKERGQMTIGLHRYDAADDKLVSVEETARRLAMLRIVREKIAELIKPTGRTSRTALAASSGSTAERRTLGAKIKSVDAETAKSLDLPKTTGAFVVGIKSQSVAKEAGLRISDIILSIDGKEISKAGDLPRVLKQVPANRLVPVVLWRDRDITTLRIFLGPTDQRPGGAIPVAAKRKPAVNPPPPAAKKVSPPPTKEAKPASKQDRRTLGVKVGVIRLDKAKALGLPKPTGALVLRVDPLGAGKAAGVRAEDVLLTIDGNAIAHARELAKLVAATDPTRVVTLTVWRDGRGVNLPLFLGGGKPPAK